MKRTLFFALITLAAVLIFNTCGKNNPAGPATPVPTATFSPTSFVPPTETMTHTISPTASITPTFTVTCTETPFIIDDFEDNDMYNNINPSTNSWAGYVNIPDAPSNTYTINSFDITLSGGLGSSHGLLIIGTSFADNPDGGGSYFTHYGMSTPVLFAPSTGVNFTQYRNLIYYISAYIWTLPSAGTYYFKVKLFNDAGKILEQNMSGLILGWAFQQMSLDISAFALPSGATGYTAADVLANVVEIRWEYGIVSTLNQDKSESTMKIDGIYLEK